VLSGHIRCRSLILRVFLSLESYRWR
jgi:hypothetical protein